MAFARSFGGQREAFGRAAQPLTMQRADRRLRRGTVRGMRERWVLCCLVGLCGCPSSPPDFPFDAHVDFPFDAHVDLPDASGLFDDDGGCPFGPDDAGEEALPAAGPAVEGGARGKCLLPGGRYTLTFPARSAVSAHLDTNAWASLELRRGTQTLTSFPAGHDAGAEVWFFVGTQPVVFSMTVDADAGHAGTATIAWSRSEYPTARARDSSLALVEETAGGDTFESAPLTPLTALFEFSLVEPQLQRADLPRCERPGDTSWRYYAFTLDAGAWTLQNVSLPIFPDFEAVVLGVDGGALAGGVLGDRFEFSVDATQRVVLGVSPLDGGYGTASCAFDGGTPPEVIGLSPRGVAFSTSP